VILPRQTPPIERKTRPYCGPAKRATIVTCDGQQVSLLAAVYEGRETQRSGELVQVDCPGVSRKTRIGGTND
jgi:hypothetical protein